MESTGLNQGAPSRQEVAKEKDKRTAVTSPLRPFRVPDGLFDVPEKPKEKSLTDLFRPEEPKAFRPAAGEYPEALSLPTTERADQLSTPVKQAIDTAPVLQLRSAEEAWADLIDRQIEGVSLEPKDSRTIVPETTLSMQEAGVMDLPLSASTLHERIQKAAFHDDEPAPVEQFVTQQPEQQPAHETAAPESPRVAEGAGGNNEPPHGFERPVADVPEPEQPSPSPVAAEQPGSWQTQAEAQHQERLATAVPVAAPENRIIIDRDGGGLALLVGLLDWRRGRKIRRELRRGQKRQDKQIKRLQQAQRHTVQQHERHVAEAQTMNQRLRRQLEHTAELFDRSQRHARHLEAQQQRLQAERQAVIQKAEVAVPLRVAVAETAIEQTVALPPDHRLQRSTWHTIEVDKTGQAVEQPIYAYGKEFQHEQQQETRVDTAQTAAGTALQFAMQAPARGTRVATSQGLRIPATMLDDHTVAQHSAKFSAVAQNHWIELAVIIIFFAVVSIIIVT